MSKCQMFGADLGASGGKCFAGILDGTTFTLQEIHRFAHDGVSFFVPGKDGERTERTYWDDTFLYRNIVEGLQAYRREISDSLDAIGIDTWGADGCLVSEDGETLGKTYCYRDHRLDNMIDVVKSRVDATRVYEIAGIHCQPFNLSNQLCWLVENRRDLIRPGSHFLPTPSLYYYYLGGGKEVDYSWASISQLMEAKTGTWSDELLQALNIPREILPEIVQPGASVGKLNAPLEELVGLGDVNLIATAAHDTACAFAAAPVDDPDRALIISSGTWSLVGKLIPEPITNAAAMEANLSNEGGIGNTRFLRNCMGTWLVQELRRVWAIADGSELDWNEITNMANASPAFEVVLDPDDESFYNPSDMEAAIRDFCARTGQEAPASRGGFLRAAYEGLALRYRWVNEKLCEVSGTESEAVHIVGGGCKNDLLNQFSADATGLPVLAGPEEATVVGNFMVQAMGLGAIADMAAAQPIIREAFPIKRFEPGDRQAWDAAYERFHAIASG